MKLKLKLKKTFKLKRPSKIGMTAKKKGAWRIVKMYDESSRTLSLGITYPRNGGGNAFDAFPIDTLESPKKLRALLVQKGAKLDGTVAEQQKLVAHLLRNIPAGEFVQTGKPGFRGHGFIAGPHMIGTAKDKYVWMPDDYNAGVGARAGKLSNWIDQVARPAANSSFAVMAISAGLASLLPSYVNCWIQKTKGLRPLVREGAVFNFSAHSSAGKSFLGGATASTGGSPGEVSDWDFSRRGLDELANAHNDFPFVLDDIEKHTGVEIPLLSALKVVNQNVPKGKSRAIAKSSRDKYPLLTWSCFAISSSPSPIDSIAAKLKWKRSPGEKLRLIDIPVPHPKQAGIFDRLSGNRTSRVEQGHQLIEQLASGMAANYGHLIPKWAAYLLKKNRALRVQKLVDGFVGRVVPHGKGHERRLAEKFGVIYAAGKMAVDADILPWDRSLPWKAVTKCYRLALAGISSEQVRAKAQIKTLSDLLTDPEYFPKAKPVSAGPTVYGSKTVGIRTKLQGKRICAVRHSDLRKIVGSNGSVKELLRQLKKVGALGYGQGHAGTKQLRESIKIGAKVSRPRFWIIYIDRLSLPHGPHNRLCEHVSASSHAHMLTRPTHIPAATIRHGFRYLKNAGR